MMKSNIPFNTGDRQPKWQEGDPIPDFESVLEGARAGKNGGFLNLRTWGLLAAAACAGVIAWLWPQTSEDVPILPTQETAAAVQDADFSGALAADWQAETNRYTLATNLAHYILTDDGLGVNLPADCFATDADSVVFEITLIDDAYKVFASGLPMNYDSAGVAYRFMSDGMLRVEAFDGSAPVGLQPGVTLGLEVPVKQDSVAFNHYTLLADGTWTYEAPLSPITYHQACGLREQELPVEAPASTTAPVARYAQLAGWEQKLNALRGQAPVKPFKRNPAQDHFTLDVVAAEFPALTPFGDTEFEVRGPGFHPDFFDQVWEDFRIQRITGMDRFRVTLIGEQGQREFNVVPVVPSSEFEAALAEYETAKANHTAQTQDLETKIAGQQKALEALEQQAQAARENKGARAATTLLSAIALDMDPARLVRAFEIGSLGICNVDVPIEIPKVKPVPVDVRADYNGATIRPAQAMLVDAKRNQSIALAGENVHQLRWLDRWENYLFASVDGNQFLVATPEQFEALDRKSDEPQFLDLRVIEEPLKSLEEVQAYLASEITGDSEMLSR